jgi:uroporphyrin-III C-methyltransferase / precorrin-2 dehydrogenase / sirohydrochlorin ferrochelatase
VPMRIGALARLAGAWRDRTRAALPDPDRRRHFWQAAIQGEAAQHAFAGRDAEAEAALERELDAWRRGERGGRLGEAWLVGAGPGNPELITLRGRQLLAAADVVLYDRLGAPELLRFARRDAELISVGKTPHAPSITQQEINRLLVERVVSGQRVCRLKGGDPMIFGRAGEEIEALVEAGLPFQIVPGVSAVEGCAAYAGVPLTLRDVARAVMISTGHTNERGCSMLGAFQPGQTLALYMGVAHYGSISAELIDLGHDRETPVAIVENGTMDSQRVIRTTLELLPQASERLGIRPPALLLIGETARLAERYAWFGPSRLEVFDGRAARGIARVS